MSKLRRGEPTAKEKQAAREKCYLLRARGYCELHNGPHCLGFAPLDADYCDADLRR
jgi:hypothetical protein